MWSLGLIHRGRSKVCIGDHRTRSCHSQVFGEEDTRSHRASCPGVMTLNPETQSVLHSSCSRGLVAAILYIALSTKPCGRILASLLVFSQCLLRNRCSSMELCSTTSFPDWPTRSGWPFQHRDSEHYWFSHRDIRGGDPLCRSLKIRRRSYFSRSRPFVPICYGIDLGR